MLLGLRLKGLRETMPVVFLLIGGLLLIEPSAAQWVLGAYALFVVDHPIEKHSDCCKGLLDRRFGMLPAEFFDVACDRHGFESVEAKAPVVTPIGKLADGAKVGRPRVRVSDVDREKLDEPASCIGSCVRNECRNGTSSLGQQGNRMANSDDTVSHLDFRMEIRLREECSTPRTDRGRESGSYRTK